MENGQDRSRRLRREPKRRQPVSAKGKVKLERGIHRYTVLILYIK